MIRDGEFDSEFQEEQSELYWQDELASLACALATFDLHEPSGSGRLLGIGIPKAKPTD